MTTDTHVLPEHLNFNPEFAEALDAAVAPVSIRVRFEDAFDFLETLPDFISLGLEETGGSRIYYFLEPDEIVAGEHGVDLTGSNLLVQIAMERTGYEVEIDVHHPGREQIILIVLPASEA